MSTNNMAREKKDLVTGKGWPDVASKTLDTLGNLGPWVIILVLIGYGLYQYTQVTRADREQSRKDFEVANSALNKTYKQIADLNEKMTTNLDAAFNLQMRLNNEIQKGREEIKLTEQRALKFRLEGERDLSEAKRLTREIEQIKSEIIEVQKRATELKKQREEIEKELNQKKETLNETITKISELRNAFVALKKEVQKDSQSLPPKTVKLVNEASELLADVEDSIPVVERPINPSMIPVR